MKWIQIVAISIISICISNSASATSNVQSCTGQYGDYSNNALDSTSACHKTDAWQSLGTEWNADTGSESNISTNDGVSWRTKTADGEWTDYGTDNIIPAGGDVQFKFDVKRAITGNHKYDLLKAWVDWGNDGINEVNDVVIEQKWWKDRDSDGVQQTWEALDQSKVTVNWGKHRTTNEGTWNWDLHKINSQDTNASFFSTVYAIPETLSEIWLRARVVCENSLTNYSDNNNLLSYGYQDQGEVEDYQLTIVNRAAKDVPEPSTLFIFALGLIAFVTQRKQA